MSAVIGFAVCQLAGLLDANYKPVYPKGNWMGMTLTNDSDQPISLCTDTDDAATAMTIAAGTGFSVQALFGPPSSPAYRFSPEKIAFYLKTASGDGTGAFITWA